MLIFIPNFTLARCIYKKNQRKTGKHLKGTPSFGRAGSVLLNILRQILVLRSWLLLLCIHRHSMEVNLTHGLLHRKLVLLCVHIVTERLGGYLCSFKPFRHLFFLMGEMILKYIIMHVFPPKQEECLVVSCILIPTVTTFHSNIRHRPTKVSVQASKNYKWIMVCFPPIHPSSTTWPIIISMIIIISISAYCLGWLLLFFGFSSVFYLGFEHLLSHSFWLLNSTRIRDQSALQIFRWMRKLWFRTLPTQNALSVSYRL